MIAPDWTDAAIDALVAECESHERSGGEFASLTREVTLVRDRSRLLSALRSLRERVRLTEEEATFVGRLRFERWHEVPDSREAKALAIIDRLTGRQP